jgi:hypothetical protein
LEDSERLKDQGGSNRSVQLAQSKNVVEERFGSARDIHCMFTHLIVVLLTNGFDQGHHEP